MLTILGNMHPIVQALLATCFTWGVTSLGAAAVFLARQPSRRTLDGMLGFAAGVMIAASYWSLLAPAIEMSEGQGGPSWLPPAIGFLLGGFFLRGLDMLLPHLHRGLPRSKAEGIETSWPRSTLFVLAVTLHNIPEGLAVGVAFGAVAVGLEASSLTAAVALALGIGLQNFPEGVAVSMPLRRDGLSPLKSFWYGQLSGFVEVVAGVIGAATVLLARPILPYALAFAAGAMIFVVIEEVVPETQQGEFGDFATLCAMFGFVVMMSLDVGLG
ncbi:transporter, putative [Syntrophotalea carbinolica DSM 2380]|uniref:Transporter, putative n=1 Tax=Syntrophotalea carbinolica (strain DSM 2380 / NBRC 103641 / GraBd1) TaxID=338963 RepID=Q3A339_SYNC1|nr:ZIP family metal transporter [Syntrophotalea carbinolica]ABA89218.1 transporter, putative [Syntrophotalea carbinolica DSM 2380]